MIPYCFFKKLFTFLLGLGSFVEPCHVVYEVENPALTAASINLKSCLADSADDKVVVEKARAQRIERVRLWNKGSAETVRADSIIVGSSLTIDFRLKLSWISLTPLIPTGDMQSSR